jgi:pseudouridine kinase
MASVLVVGGSNIDIKAKTTAPHIAATSNPGVISTSFGGVGRNIASNLARLGAETSFITAVGDDGQGQQLLAALARENVDTSACLTVGGPTGAYCAVLDASGELVTAVSHMQALEAVTPDIIENEAERFARATLVVADCNLLPATLAAIARAAPGKLIVEPVSVTKSEKLWRLLDDHQVLAATPNLHQLSSLMPGTGVYEAVVALRRLGIANVIVHAGADGAYGFDGNQLVHVPAQAQTVKDVTGAGDAAVSGMVYGLLKKMPLAEAIAVGQKAAAKVIASALSALE